MFFQEYQILTLLENNMNNLRLNPNGTVTLCARKTCCPTVERIDNEMVKITDDNGNAITIRKEQASLIKDGIDIIYNTDNRELLCE